jgi:hypothetical protein
VLYQERTFNHIKVVHLEKTRRQTTPLHIERDSKRVMIFGTLYIVGGHNFHIYINELNGFYGKCIVSVRKTNVYTSTMKLCLIIKNGFVFTSPLKKDEPADMWIFKEYENVHVAVFRASYSPITHAFNQPIMIPYDESLKK